MLAVIDLQPQVVEVAGVPQHHEVAPQGLGIEQVAPLGEDPSGQVVTRDAARAAELDCLDDLLVGPALRFLRLLHVLERGGGVGLFQRDVLKRRGGLLSGLCQQVRRHRRAKAGFAGVCRTRRPGRRVRALGGATVLGCQRGSQGQG